MQGKVDLWVFRHGQGEITEGQHFYDTGAKLDENGC